MNNNMKYILLLWVLKVMTITVSAQTLPQTFTHTLTNGTDSYTINFSRFDTRGPLFEVSVQQADGSFQTVNVGDARTYIGTVNGQPGAVAAGLRRADGSIYTRMTLENGFEWIDYDGTLTIEERELTPSWPTFGLRAGGAGSTLYASDIFFDLTNRYYGTVGGTAARCAEMVDFSMMAINLIYFRDANIYLRTGRVSIRADLTNDPYSADGGVMANLLSTLNTESAPWVDGANANTDHDQATVIQSLVGGGLASVGSVGTGRSANGGFSRGDFTGAARHEFGHNWGMGHFDGRSDGEPLSPEGKTINSGNGLAKMSAPEIELVLRERDDAMSILSNRGTTAPDLPPRAADDRLTVDNILVGQTLTVQPLVNDSDCNGESLSVVSVDPTSNLGATVSLNSNNTFSVVFPSSYAYGYDYFRYQISDQSGRTSSAVVHLQMSPAKQEWELGPVPVDGTSLYMVASDKFDAAGTVEYYFEHVNGTQHSGWQTSRTFLATSLTTGQEQTYRVYTRLQNTTNSSLASDDFSAVPISVSAGVLFTDSFDRTALNDTGGQSGVATPATYTLTSFGTVTAGIVSNQLLINGPASNSTLGALAYINNFNFGSPVMRSFDQVSVKVDIAGYSTVGSSRQMTLAIGQSLAELENQAGVSPTDSSADLLVAFRQTTSTIEIYKSGTLISAESVTGNFVSAPTELEIVYNSPSLLEGSSVSYEVYLDGRTTPHTSGTFTWSGDYQNYISLSSNLSNNALFDNLDVEVATTPGFTPPPFDSGTFIPDPSKKYYIDSPHHNLRIGATGNSEDPFTTSTTTTGSQVEWVFVDKGNGSWHVQLAAGGSTPRLRSRNNGQADMQGTSSSGSWTYYDFTPGALTGTYFMTLPDHNVNRSRLQVDNGGVVKFVPETSAGTWESFRFTEVQNNPNLVAHWTMDETSGTNVADSSGNGFNGTMTNASHVTGTENGGLEFNGSSSSVSVPASTFAEIDDEITIAMWTYGGTGQARSDTIFRATNATGGRVLNIHLPWGNSQVYWDAGLTNTYDRINKGAATAAFKGQWNHWVFTKNNNTGAMAIYLNGSLWHTGTGKTRSMAGITSATIGSANGVQSYQGTMDEVMIFKTSLTASEVADLYNSY